MQSTVKVRVDMVESHPVYKKIIKRKKVYFAHTDKELNVGDVVTIRESKPYSKKVRWLVIKKEE
jgi:small subunit ribosomal protein S17